MVGWSGVVVEWQVGGVGFSSREVILMVVDRGFKWLWISSNSVDV